eukprot:scaffold24572_cov102-Skeletonema_marinoi.AAC.1
MLLELEFCRRSSQIGPHPVAYEAAAWLIHKDDNTRQYIIDGSSGHLRRCRHTDTVKKNLSRDKDILSYSLREIRYCAREQCWQLCQMPHQVTYDVVATPIRPTNA